MSAARARREKLTVYAIRERVGGQRVTEFDQVVEPDMLKSDEVHPHDVPGGIDFDARFYLLVGPPTRPSFATFLGAVEGIQWPTRMAVGGLLVIRLRPDGDFFALSFERSGKRLLRDDAYEHGYGLKVALNVICENIDEEEVRLRQFTTRRVTDYVMDTRRQASQPAPFAAFGMDPQQDLLRGVVGPPAKEEVWGHQIEGADHVTVQLALDLNGVGWLCQAVKRMHGRPDYKRWFDWVDNIQAVREPETRSHLEAILCERLRHGTSDLVLTVPEVLEWERVDYFRLVVGRRKVPLNMLNLQGYLELLEETGQRAQLDISKLQRHRVEALDPHGDLAYPRWSVLRCLEGEVRAGRSEAGTTYFVSNGEFYEVGLTFITNLHQELTRIPRTALRLPTYREGDDEGAYNQNAAAASGMLLLDKRDVYLNNRDKVELSDLLTENAGAFVYVKRHFVSKQLSHLFSQGEVASRLLVDDVNFRRLAARTVRETEEKVERETGRTGYVGRFSAPLSDSYAAYGRELVFAIIGPWQGHDLARLPLFSKVNLRGRAELIRSRGYRLTYAPIEE